ncbi:MAG: hypothetical protein M9942_03120 [Microthrixaceae bacterium]|nr:hypothetical protein [Microthrixaceae bacterium]
MADDDTAGDPGDPAAGRRPRNGSGRVRRWLRRAGNQGSRVLLLAAVVAMFGMGVGYALGFPLRYVDYEASSAISLDQASLAGTVDVEAALVAEGDLGPGWVPGDEALGVFGVLGAPVCGTEIDTPTPLSAKEVAVWADDTNSARIISQALRVTRWSDAEQYIEEVADELEECDTFYRTDAGQRTRVTSREIDRDPPVTDHVGRRFQSPTGVQDWSMMVVGDVIIAIQYLAPTPSPDGFLGEVERSVLERVAPAEFAPGGVDPAEREGTDEADPDAQDGAGSGSEPTAGSGDSPTGAADETGGN